MVIRFFKNIVFTIVGVIILFLCIAIIIAAFVIVGEFKENDWSLGADCYVSDDLNVLYVDNTAYERIEIPFDMLSPREPYSEFSCQFANSEYEHSKVYAESISRRYPLVWITDISYHLYVNYLSNDLLIMQLSNEDTDEVYNYCLPEHRSQIEEIVNDVSWSDNNLFAEYIDHNGNLIDGVNKEKISSDLSSYIITAREKLLSDVTSRREIGFADRSSAVGVSIYQYDNGMNFRKKMFDIMVLTNGNYYLYDDFYMYYASNTPNATIDDYNYLLLPEMFNEKIKQYQEKAKEHQNQ